MVGGAREGKRNTLPQVIEEESVNGKTTSLAVGRERSAVREIGM